MQRTFEGSTRLRRAGSAALVMALALAAVVFPSASARAEPRTYYLDGDGVPIASLVTTGPSGSLPNHDAVRNSDPGLTIEKGGSGATETDPTQYQMWLVDSAMELDGPVSFTFWSAMSGFANDQRGGVKALLLDCSGSGTGCTTLATASVNNNPWSSSTSWASTTVSFGSIAHNIDPGRTLAVMIVVGSSAADAMWFAYDAAAYPSRLTVDTTTPATTTTQPPPSTTTTSTTSPPPTSSTTTTTSAPPSSTTTTTSTPPGSPTTSTTTTSLPPGSPTTSTTTTSLPPGSPTSTITTSPTTTTTVPPASTTTTPGSTTTTTLASPTASGTDPDAGRASSDSGSVPTKNYSNGIVAAPKTTTDPESSPPPERNPSLSVLPRTGDEYAGSGGAISGRLIDELEAVIPSLAAVAIVSPVVVLEAFFGAFVETGRDLVLPGLILFFGLIWIAHSSRRNRPMERSQ